MLAATDSLVVVRIVDIRGELNYSGVYSRGRNGIPADSVL